MSSSTNSFYSESGLDTSNSPPVDGTGMKQVDEFCAITTAQLDSLIVTVQDLKRTNVILLDKINQNSVILTAILQNMQESNRKSIADSSGFEWKSKNSNVKKSLNWIVKQIQITGKNSILPSQLGLKWNSEFPNTDPSWVTETKANGLKKGIKRFVKDYGNGILSVEDTTNHAMAKILFNH